MKNITLGQYIPGNSPMHKMDPRLKLVIAMGYIVVLFLAKGPVSYGLCAAALLISAAVARLGARVLWDSIRPLWFVIVFTAVINLFYSPEGTVLVHFWRITVTTGGVYAAVTMALRILLLIMGTFVFLNYTTSPILLTDGLEQLLNPLRKIKVPVHELSMMMTIALRFIPTLMEETDKIISAQKARGADFESGNLVRRAKALLPILVPLFVSSFRRADELATAMECRCYRGGEGRTRLHVFRFEKRDWIAAVIAALTAAAVITAAAFGL